MEDLSIISSMAGIEIHKMTGTGNDFILVDNRVAEVPPEAMPLLARAVCQRRRSAGADGLILLSTTDRVDPERGKVDFRWDFFNADGSSAEMCGNGGRCAARFAHDVGLAGARMVFDTLAGPIRAQVDGATVKLEMTRPHGVYKDLNLEIGGSPMVIDGVNTGVPHAVVAVEDLSGADVLRWGREIRWHEHFQPAGTNANFIAAQDGELVVRTYERGVEDETLACGTGAVASALVAGRRGWLRSPVTVLVASGERLRVHFGEGRDEVFLEGAAHYVYTGRLHREAWAWLEV